MSSRKVIVEQMNFIKLVHCLSDKIQLTHALSQKYTFHSGPEYQEPRREIRALILLLSNESYKEKKPSYICKVLNYRPSYVKHFVSNTYEQGSSYYKDICQTTKHILNDYIIRTADGSKISVPQAAEDCFIQIEDACKKYARIQLKPTQNADAQQSHIHKIIKTLPHDSYFKNFFSTNASKQPQESLESILKKVKTGLQSP